MLVIDAILYSHASLVRPAHVYTLPLRTGRVKLTIALLGPVLQAPNPTSKPVETIRDSQNQDLGRWHTFFGDRPLARYLARNVDAISARNS
jgi:hypothetical protein